MIIRLNKITRFHGTRLILKDISFSIAAGSINLLVGPNGAGKSTLLHIMAGLLTPNAGSVTYTEADDFTVGYLGHATFLYPQLTALENLAFWQRLYNKPSSTPELEAALEQVGLLPFAYEKARVFSRGMAQRLNLARVFLLRPTLLLLDEPATGLDVRSTTLLHQTIVKAKDEGCAVVWVSHFLDQDTCHADSIIHIENKKLAFLGTPAQYSASQCTLNCKAQHTEQEKLC